MHKVNIWICKKSIYTHKPHPYGHRTWAAGEPETEKQYWMPNRSCFLSKESLIFSSHISIFYKIEF